MSDLLDPFGGFKNFKRLQAISLWSKLAQQSDDPQWPMALGLESLVGVRVFYNEASYKSSAEKQADLIPM